MGFEFLFTFLNAGDKSIGGVRMERKYTHYNTELRSFYETIVYNKISKKELVSIFKTQMDKFDINSEEFALLIGGLSAIVNDCDWSDAVNIDVTKN